MQNVLLDLFLPPVCLGCDALIAPGDTARLVCRRCRTLLRRAPPPCCERCGAPLLRTGRPRPDAGCDECAAWPAELVRARSAFLMHPPADRIVHQIKYRGWSALAPVMAEPMARSWKETGAGVALITPVPTTSSRLRERGYNQAELIARAVAEQLAMTCETVLERTTAKSTQTTLQPAARGANVAGAFRLQHRSLPRVQNADILLIDDVLTTGATAIECARTLVEAGARTVSVLTYARALDTRRLLGV